MEKAERISREVFIGGPLHLFEIAGRKQLIYLIAEGLYPSSKILDIGCGCLRGGYWMIHFLDKGCFCGIEPNREMLKLGINELLTPELLNLKEPRFNHNSTFDMSIFKEKFDYIVARSIWTHSSKLHIMKMLDGFIDNTTDNGVFLTSYLKPTVEHPDYQGDSWVGRNHLSDMPGVVRHDYNWIKNECRIRKLHVSENIDSAYNFGNQIWLSIKK